MTCQKRVSFVIPSNLRRIRFLNSPTGLRLLERISHFVFYNVGTLQLATIIKERGHTVRFHIDSGGPLKRSQIDADVICIYLTTATASRGYEIAKMFPDRKIILGGPHASALPEEASRYADHVVIGEGENVLPDIVEGNNTAKVVHAGLIGNLDSLPFLDLSLLPFRPASYPILTSRGCPFMCNFCAVTKMSGRKVRLRSPESIVHEVKHYESRHGMAARLDLISPNFTINAKHCREILKRLLAEGLRPALEIRSSATVARDPEIPRLLSRFPSVSMLIGAETFDEATLAYYRKGRKATDLLEVVNVMRDHGIHVITSFIWGSKYDSPDSIWRLLDAIYEIRPSHFQIGLLTPFPGTDFYDEVQDRIFVKDWSAFDMMHVTHYHPTMDPYRMQKTWIDAQKQIWSLRNILKHHANLPALRRLLRTGVLLGPINKMFHRLVAPEADSKFSDYLEFLRRLEYPPRV